MQEGEQHDFRQHQAVFGRMPGFRKLPLLVSWVSRAPVSTLGKWSFLHRLHQYLIALAQLFHTTTDDILGLESQEQIVLRGMNEQEKRLVYDLISYIKERKEEE